MWRQVQRLLRRKLSSADLSRVQDAFELAWAVHRDQLRDDGSPYMLHPLRVIEILVSEFGFSHPGVIQAALLHDVLEDHPNLSTAAVGERFGPAVVSIVTELTKPRRGDRGRDEVTQAYFGALVTSSERARIIKLADKLDNVRDAVNSPDPAKRARTRRDARKLFRLLCPTLEDRAMAGRIAAALAAGLASGEGD